MQREERLKFCNVCTNRSFDPKVGTICSITGSIATFENTCESFQEDAKEVEIITNKQEAAEEEDNLLINKARIGLFFMSGIFFITSIISFVSFDDIFEKINGFIHIALGIYFLILGLRSLSKPHNSFVNGLVAYLFTLSFYISLDLSFLLQGIIIKGVIITYLIYGIITSREKAKKTNSENLQFNHVRMGMILQSSLFLLLGILTTVVAREFQFITGFVSAIILFLFIIVFIGLSFGATSKPFYTGIAGIIVFLVTQFLLKSNDNSILFSGFALVIPFLAYMIFAIIDAKKNEVIS